MKRNLRLFITLAAFIIFYAAYFFSPYFLPVNYNTDVYISGIKPNVGLILAPTPFLINNIIFELIEHSMKKSATNSGSKEKSKKINSDISLLQSSSLFICADLICIMSYYLYIVIKTCLQPDKDFYFDISKISTLVLSVLFIVLSIFLLNIKKNNVFGLRTSYSMYNENTWKKSNLFAGISGIISGTAAFICSLIFKDFGCITAFMIILFIWCVLCAIASYIFYKNTVCQKRE
ncbi:MAG: SdpI family protein [Lachnospira sp.]